MTAAQPRVSTASMTTSTVTSPPIVTPEVEVVVDHPTIEEGECRGGLQVAAEVEVQEFIFFIILCIYIFDNCRWRRIQASLQLLPHSLPHTSAPLRRQEAILRGQEARSRCPSDGRAGAGAGVAWSG